MAAVKEDSYTLSAVSRPDKMLVNRLILAPIVTALVLAVAVPGRSGTELIASRQLSGTAPGGTLLSATEVDTLLPDAVFFQGMRLPVESRNSPGIRFPDGMYLLAALVDSSGHNTASGERLGCLLTEVPLDVNGHKLTPGAYGIDLDDRDRFIMMDIAAHRVFAASSEHDSVLLRPRPLQILLDPPTQHFRLYLGRNYISLSRVRTSLK